MQLVTKASLRLALIAMLFQGNPSFVSAQMSNDDISSGALVFVFEKPAKSPAFRGASAQQRVRKNKRRPIIKKKSVMPTLQTGSNSNSKPGGKMPADEPIAPAEWINEGADNAIEERKITDEEPILFLSQGYLNSRMNGCSAPVFPAAARKAKLKKVSLKLSITVAKYGGVLDAQVISGDAMFRQAVYKSLESMTFRQSYFMGEPVRVQGIVEFTQHDSDSYNMIGCKESAVGVPVGDPTLPTEIDGGILNDNATSCESPEFPADAKAANLKSVEAAVQVVLDEQGKVVSAKPIDGHPTFSQAAAQAAMRATFRKSAITNVLVKKVSGVMVFTQTPNNDVSCKTTAAD
jgi:outer membrane biosynthesis protein TonB